MGCDLFWFDRLLVLGEFCGIRKEGTNAGFQFVRRSSMTLEVWIGWFSYILGVITRITRLDQKLFSRLQLLYSAFVLRPRRLLFS
jgi:hypothetical protein